MISHPLTFLVGYVLVTFILSFVVVGPLVVFMSILFSRRVEKRYTDGHDDHYNNQFYQGEAP